jgi:metal-responsive CopG/Arc/MetJ family transcriptional regulator
MGRPPLSKKSDTKPILVRLTAEVCEAMDAIAGPNRRAEFIREAIEREIKRRSRKSDREE